MTRREKVLIDLSRWIYFQKSLLAREFDYSNERLVYETGRFSKNLRVIRSDYVERDGVIHETENWNRAGSNSIILKIYFTYICFFQCFHLFDL